MRTKITETSTLAFRLFQVAISKPFTPVSVATHNATFLSSSVAHRSGAMAQALTSSQKLAAINTKMTFADAIHQPESLCTECRLRNCKKCVNSWKHVASRVCFSMIMMVRNTTTFIQKNKENMIFPAFLLPSAITFSSCQCIPMDKAI
jgi:hypothetical protein